MKFFSEQWLDLGGNPAGGVSSGRGFAISWQNGPLGRGNDRKEPNGAFVEDILEAVKDRLEFYQHNKFACSENAEAISQITSALAVLSLRTQRREERKVEGTYQA